MQGWRSSGLTGDLSAGKLWAALLPGLGPPTHSAASLCNHSSNNSLSTPRHPCFGYPSERQIHKLSREGLGPLRLHGLRKEGEKTVGKAVLHTWGGKSVLIAATQLLKASDDQALLMTAQWTLKQGLVYACMFMVAVLFECPRSDT